MGAESAYLSQAHIPGQQQDKQRVLGRFTEEQHEGVDRTAGRRWPRQTKTREARHVDDHMTLGHPIRGDELHAIPGGVHHRQEVLIAS